MNEIFFEVILGVVVVIAVIITKYLVPYLKAQVQETEYAELLDTVETAVKAAEQTITASGMGKAKKAEVEKFLVTYLNERNINITEEQLDKLIEAAVYTMNNSEGGKW